MAEEFYLDWKKDTLQIWEREKSDIIIAAMIEGIELSCDFPAVNVVKLDKNFYRLAPGEKNPNTCLRDGGHYRAVAHYIKGAQLKCRLTKILEVDPDRFGCIENVVIYDHEDIEDKKFSDSLKKLPLDVAKRFCLENELQPKWYLSQ